MINLKKHFMVKFVLALFVVGILFGIVVHFTYKTDISEMIVAFKSAVTTSKQNTFLSSIVIVSAIFVLSISVIGIPVVVFYLFYEGLALGFTMSIFASTFKLRGLFFYILYFLFSKSAFLLIIGYFSILSMKYSIKFIESLTSKNKETLYKTIVFHTMRYLIVLSVTLLNSTFIYLFSNKIVSLFLNLINN